MLEAFSHYIYFLMQNICSESIFVCVSMMYVYKNTQINQPATATSHRVHVVTLPFSIFNNNGNIFDDLWFTATTTTAEIWKYAIEKHRLPIDFSWVGFHTFAQSSGK